MATTIHQPVRFPGTPEQIAENRLTHCFFDLEDPRCGNCDCRPGGIVATWPCGADVPIEVLVYG